MHARLVAALATVALAVMVVVVGAVGPGPDTAAAQTETERELDRARAALEQLEAELDDAEREVSSRQSGLAEAEDQLARIEAVVNEVALQVERQRVLVRDAEADLLQAVRSLEQLEELAVERIARLFKQGPELTFETLLSSSGAEEAIARTELLERVVLADQVDLELLDAQRVNVEVRRGIVEAEQARLETQLEEQQALRQQAEELRASRALAAADAQQRARELGEEHQELEAEEDALVARIEEQQAEERRQEAARQAAARAGAARSAPSTSAPRRSSGGLAWPMCAPVTSEYGPRWGTLHRGIDLGAPVGTPIRAVAAGTVIFAGWQGGYGNMTLIDHGGVVSAYAHQSGFAVGQGAGVGQGQVIGYIGMTGFTTGPHLHLELRVGGSAVNPRQYLSGSPC